MTEKIAGIELIFQLVFLNQPLLVIILLVVVFTVLYYYRAMFRGLRNRLVFESFTKDTDQTVEPSRKEGMECPRCGGRMTQGYLVSASTIYWSRRLVGLLPRFVTGIYGPRIPGFGRRSYFETSLEAHRCRSCEIIYIDARQNLIPEAG